jgi:hypothetical protein
MPNINSILDKHVTFQCECIDRMYLNAYIPILQLPGQMVSFLMKQRQQPIPSPALLGQLSRSFVAAVERFAETEHIPIIRFQKGQRKEEVARPYFEQVAGGEGVVLIGVAQEKATAFRGYHPRRGPTGVPHYEFTRASVCVNHYYFYILDRYFGPSFIKICSYAPFTGRVWLNGHEWVKRQLNKRGVSFTGLDNCLLSAPEPALVQQVCDSLSAGHVAAFFRRWMTVLPQPLPVEDRQAGYRYELSILQFEVSLTKVFDRPLSGRQFFEEAIRDHLDLGRPDQVQLIFDRRITRRTPGRFRTRVITAGVDPSLHVDYKHSRIKQYYKQGRALRTETTINDTRDFGIGRNLSHLPDLVTIGREANRRLLDAQRTSQRCAISATTFQQVILPSTIDGQRTPGLRFGDPRVMALFASLCQFCHLPNGFTNASLRPLVAAHLALLDYNSHQMTYDLRRLRRKGFIQRLPEKHRYILTPQGRRMTFFFAKTFSRILQPGLNQLDPSTPHDDITPLAKAWHHFDDTLTLFISQSNLIP